MTTLERGKPNFKEKIQESISLYLSDWHSPPTFTFRHIPSGFTDNVFLVEAAGSGGHDTQRFIAKEYLEVWHKKERVVYQEILQHHAFLGAPILISAKEEFIILEHLPQQKCNPATSGDLNLLQEWIVNKHNYFRTHTEPLDRFTEDEKVQIRYLVEKPLKLLKQLNIEGREGTVKRVLELGDYFVNIVKFNNSLPPTLEHGDLESQNIFVERNKRLRIIDWVNTRKGSGLFDINQFFETARELRADINPEEKVKEFAEFVGLDDLYVSLPRVRMLMLLNKIHFYGAKYLHGEYYSFSKSQPTLALLNDFLSELNGLINKPGILQ